MMPSISLKAEGLFNPSQLEAWTTDRQRRLRTASIAAMREWGRETAEAVNGVVRSRMKVRRRQFPGFRYKLFADKPDRLPAVMISSKIPWLGIHGSGGTITARHSKGLLIPLLDSRIGTKAFRRIVDSIIRNGAGFFKEVNGRVLLFAEYQSEYGRDLARFRRQAWKSMTPIRRWAGVDIPIAVLVPRVEIRKRFDLDFEVRRRLPRLVSLLESHIARASPLGL